MNNIVKVGASGICHDKKENKILLGLRSKTDTSLPGMWCSPGGQVEFGETIDECIVREFKEETGLEVEVSPHFKSVHERMTGIKHAVLIFKQVRIIKGNPLPLDGFDNIGWFSYDEIRDMAGDITPMTYEAIGEYLLFQNFVEQCERLMIGP